MNITGYGAAADLGLDGLGDSLTKQLLDQEAERKKKMKPAAGIDPMTNAVGGLAAMDLGVRANG